MQTMKAQGRQDPWGLEPVLYGAVRYETAFGVPWSRFGVLAGCEGAAGRVWARPAKQEQQPAGAASQVRTTLGPGPTTLG
jgi:hypothetical protein